MMSTLPDFWRMIWEQDVRIIVMVSALEERGKVLYLVNSVRCSV